MLLRTEPLTLIAAFPWFIWDTTKGAVCGCVVEGLVGKSDFSGDEEAYVRR
jgi:hypothetical protein